MHAELHRLGIAVQVHFVPTYRFAAYADLGLDPDTHASAFPATEAAYAGLLSLPLFPDLTHDDQQTVIDALIGIVSSGR